MKGSVNKWTCRSALVLAGVALLSCEPVEEVPAEPIPNIPVPTALSGFLSADGVQLFWEFDSTYSYSGFVVSRSEDDQATWFDVATVQGPPYSDSNLRSQFTYWYRIAGLDQNAVRGNWSVSWPARPAVYEVLIDNGAPVTGSQDVVLTFTAPAGTQNVRFSEDPDLEDIQWRDFLAQFAFTLTTGDGEKTVWAQFIDAAGNLTQPVSASITLDTFAGIDTLFFETLPPSSIDLVTIAPGGSVKFTIVTDALETGGVCDVFVEGMGATPIQVYDDGRNGDAQAEDGTYQRDYTFALSFRQASMRMSAGFADAAGNASAEREFQNNLFMSDPPDAVTLNPINQTTSDSITLNWTRSTDDHFTAYQIYRDTQSGVDPITSILAGTVSDQSATVFTDTELPSGSSFWYAVFVVNDLEEGTKSNEEQGSTLP